MAYLGVDSWRWQYFADVPCPAGLDIPVDEASAWALFPAHRHIHNKLWICESQSVPHAPHGVEPAKFPIFSKPIFNLRGMGTGGRIIRSKRAYWAAVTPGHMWMPLFTGPHVSTDAAVLRGEVEWWRHTTGKPASQGTFDHWTVHAEHDAVLERYLGAWIRRYLADFTGVINFETIGGKIIECHLRMAEQWLDLNGEDWLKAVVDLYRSRRWRFADADRRTGYSVILFGPHGRQFRAPSAARVAALRRSDPAISSIQITFEDSRPAAQHAMPPGGFRLAIVNCWDLRAGRAIRRRLAAEFALS